jgi:hypothetical protein
MGKRVVTLDVLKQINACLKPAKFDDGPRITSFELRHAIKDSLDDIIEAIEVLAAHSQIEVPKDLELRRTRILKKLEALERRL